MGVSGRLTNCGEKFASIFKVCLNVKYIFIIYKVLHCLLLFVDVHFTLGEWGVGESREGKTCTDTHTHTQETHTGCALSVLIVASKVSGREREREKGRKMAVQG